MWDGDAPRRTQRVPGMGTLEVIGTSGVAYQVFPSLVVLSCHGAGTIVHPVREPGGPHRPEAQDPLRDAWSHRSVYRALGERAF